jgi:hypothetical protein
MGLFKPRQYFYTEQELEVIEAHIVKYFGDFDMVYHEIVSPDIHCDVVKILPAPGRDYVTLVTMGAGAYKMKLPKQLRKDYFIKRAEFVLTVPSDWNFDEGESENERNYWVFRALKNMARVSIWNNTWVGFGHTMSFDEYNTPFADNTKLCSVLVNMPEQFEKDDDDGAFCETISKGNLVAFFQLIPIYESELMFAREQGSEALLERLGDIAVKPIDINRKSVV